MKKPSLVPRLVLFPSFFFVIGVFYAARKIYPFITEKQKELEKDRKLFLVLCDWMERKQQGKSIKKFLGNNDCHTVAIYGLGNIGILLERELKGLVEICYGIDRRDVSAGFPVYKLEDDLPAVDMIIVTAAYGFDEIEEELKTKTDCPIYSIEDIIFFME